MPPYYRALLASEFVFSLGREWIVDDYIMDYRYRNVRQMCPRCNHHWTGDIPSSVMRLKKVYSHHDGNIVSSVAYFYTG